MDKNVNHGNELIDYYNIPKEDFSTIPFTVVKTDDRIKSIDKLKNKDADALIIIDGSFSQLLEKQKQKGDSIAPSIEFIGDLTNTNYLISAVWANEILNEFIFQTTNSKRLVEVKETPLGMSASINDFDMIVPGILIISLIMLMFTASIAFVSEVENKTIIRLKLSKLPLLNF